MSTAIQSELMEIKGNKELLTAEEVVKWAKANKASALHGHFQWDLKKAAHRHWLHTARNLIAIHVTYENGTRQLVSLSIDRSKTGGYRNVDDVVKVPALYEIMIEDALRELKRVEMRFEAVKALKPVWQAIERVRARRRKAVEHKPRVSA